MPQPVCFTCGLAVGEPHRLNRLDNGQICPACRERVLDSLPPILPGTVGVAATDVAEAVDPVVDERGGPSAAS